MKVSFTVLFTVSASKPLLTSCILSLTASSRWFVLTSLEGWWFIMLAMRNCACTMGVPIIIWMSSSSCLYSVLLWGALTQCWCHSAQAKCLTSCMNNWLSSTFGFCVLEFCHEMSLYLRKSWVISSLWLGAPPSGVYATYTWTILVGLHGALNLNIAVRADCWVFLKFGFFVI